MFTDITYSTRLLLKSPGFALVAIASLALGIGVNTAVLSVARSVILKPLSVRAPSELAVAYWTRPDGVRMRNINSGGAPHPRTGRGMDSNYTYGAYLALHAAVRESAGVFAFTFMRQANVFAGDLPVAAAGLLVSGNYFEVLGPPVIVGRGIEPSDDREGAEPVAVIGHALWQRAFGGDRAIVGQTIRLNGRSFAIVGVTGPGYFGVSNGGFFPPSDVTVALSAQPLIYPRWTPEQGTLFTSTDQFWLRVMLRIPGGNTPAAAQRLEPLLSQALAGHFANASPALGITQAPVTLLDGARGLDSMRRRLERPIALLGGVAALVFLIACMNLANLMLVRGMARQYEFRVRLALGAGRSRLVRQTLAEGLLLAATGGLAGTLLASWGARALVATIVGSTPHALTVDLDWRLIAIGAAVSAAAAMLFGLLPALRLSRANASDLVRQSGVARSAPKLRAGRALVMLQVAVSVPLLAGAGLFLRTLHNLAAVDLGFNPRGVVVFRLDPGLNGYDERRVKDLYVRVLERIQSLAGVQSATLVENALVSGRTSNTTFAVGGAGLQNLSMNRVGPGYVETMGLALVGGRGIGVHDGAAGARVVVINEAAARKLFGGGSPLGRQLAFASRPAESIEIVGVVGDSKYDSLKASAAPVVLLPYLQSRGLTAMFVAVRTTPTADMLSRLRSAVAEVDRDVPITEMKTQTAQIDESISSERAFATLLVVFGAFALLLACIGLHGVTAYSVARRTSEIGLRMALGAQRRDLIWMIVRQIVILATGGLAIGIPAAAALSQSARVWLFGVEPGDPLSLAASAATLFAIAIAAAFVPARSAARLDPLTALRRE
jgi:predicted permease